MTLAFPNPSRSFDKSRNAVRFSGYDGMFEVPFYVETGALLRSLTAADKADQSGNAEQSEDAFLRAFDAARVAILDSASRAYAHRRRPTYTLTAHDIR